MIEEIMTIAICLAVLLSIAGCSEYREPQCYTAPAKQVVWGEEHETTKAYCF